ARRQWRLGPGRGGVRRGRAPCPRRRRRRLAAARGGGRGRGHRGIAGGGCMTLDIARLRAETPGCDRVLHLNHAGSSLMSAATVAAIQAHLQYEAEAGSMEAGGAVAAGIERVRTDVATLLGADAGEIAFTGGTSDGWGRAFAALRLRPGDRVLVGQTEWGGNLACLERAGLVVETVPADEHGQVSLDALGRLLDGPKVSLLALTWA